MELVKNFCRDFVWIFCMNLYGYLFGGLEYFSLCRLLVWNGCLVWFWSSMEENFI